MSCSSLKACITDPAPKNNSALNEITEKLKKVEKELVYVEQKRENQRNEITKLDSILENTKIKEKELRGEDPSIDIFSLEKYRKKLNEFYVKWKSKHNFSILSMGMSNDYMLAIENGSNLIRIGSLIFGSRI